MPSTCRIEKIPLLKPQDAPSLVGSLSMSRARQGLGEMLCLAYCCSVTMVIVWHVVRYR